MKIKQKLWKRLRFAKDSPINSKKGMSKNVSNKKYNSSDTPFKECNSKDIEEKYNISLQLQYDVLPATKIPGTDLIVEDLLFLTSAFSNTPWEVARVTICAKTDEILQEEKKAIDLLIEKAATSVVRDEEGDGYDTVSCFDNMAVVLISSKDFPSDNDGNQYICLKSSSGFTYEYIKDSGEFDDLYDNHPKNLFIFRLVAKNLLH
jgi:hypothetical protein